MATSPDPAHPDADLLAAIPVDARHILAIDAGDALASAFRARQPAAEWTGIGRDALRSLPDQRFDVVILPANLAGMDAPDQLLRQLTRRNTAGGVCILCVDNPSHWSRLPAGPSRLQLLAGEAAIGLLGRAGWTLLEARPTLGPGDATEAALRTIAPLAEALGIGRQRLRNNVTPERWIFRAINGPVPPQLHLAGLGLAKVAGVTEARIDHPLGALASLTRVRAVWGAGGLSIPPGFDPGVLIVQRQQMREPALATRSAELIAKGWAIVHEIDDDPRHWPEYVDDGFYNLRSVHAVTVSTDRLAAVLRQWNPNVAVFPNAVMALPVVPPATPKQGMRLRIFFGALNRWNDWSAISDSLLAASAMLGDRIEYVVVHDQRVFDSIPAGIGKQFHPTLPPDRYMALLASCDIALLPLEDNEFNRCKSDLKFIECCAAGAVPICSPVVYAERPEHLDIGLFAHAPEQWGRALEQLCSDAADIAERRAQGIAYVAAGRMHSQQTAAREGWYRSLLVDRDRLERERLARL